MKQFVPESAPESDVGLGTAYERLAIYRRLELWFGGRVETAAQSLVDGFAGIGGLHLLPLARTGCRVTVAGGNVRALEAVAAAYAFAGCTKQLTLLHAPRLPEADFDLVIDFNGLPNVADWRRHLGELSRSGRELCVFVSYPFSYGAWLSRGLALLERGPRRPRQYDHECTRERVLLPELRRVGELVDRAFVDCPWWPDLFVDAGTTLAGDLMTRLGARQRAPRPRFVYPAAEFPYADGAPRELEATLARHPVFDAARVAPFFAHHRAYRVRVA
ncbi:MAG: hypothetical protein IPI67_17410 [Myxococcales bacterium]|nr:hypothetical protein [Myxococcales bacterium]